jgi:hypothetical protein
MNEWNPFLVLPNLDMRGSIECDFAALVSPADPRVEKLREDHPTLNEFLGKFSDQFKKQCWPSLLLLRTNAPPACRTAEAITAFRDLASLSVIPLARARRLYYARGEHFAYSNAFQFYPWTLDGAYEHLILTNPATRSMHLLRKFEGQTFPEVRQMSLMEGHIDVPLLKVLLDKWVTRFPRASTTWSDLALFRPQHGERSCEIALCGGLYCL